MNKDCFLGLRTAVYKVSNLQKAKVWYTKAFKTKPYFDESFYVGFNIKGYELGLMPVEEKKQKRGDNSLSYWGVDNIQEVYDHLLSLGAKEHEKPTNVGGDLMTASVLDPWENVIGIIFNPYFKLPE